jgi:hypothetical protein
MKSFKSATAVVLLLAAAGFVAPAYAVGVQEIFGPKYSASGDVGVKRIHVVKVENKTRYWCATIHDDDRAPWPHNIPGGQWTGVRVDSLKRYRVDVYPGVNCTGKQRKTFYPTGAATHWIIHD